MKSLVKKIFIFTSLIASSTAFSADLGNIAADCNTVGTTTRTLTGRVGDTFSITVLPTGAICFITSSNPAVVNANPPVLNQNVTQTYTIIGTGTTTFGAKQNGNGVNVGITVAAAVPSIPTLSEAGIMLLALAMAGMTLYRMRRSGF